LNDPTRSRLECEKNVPHDGHTRNASDPALQVPIVGRHNVYPVRLDPVDDAVVGVRSLVAALNLLILSVLDCLRFTEERYDVRCKGVDVPSSIVHLVLFVALFCTSDPSFPVPLFTLVSVGTRKIWREGRMVITPSRSLYESCQLRKAVVFGGIWSDVVGGKRT
jgi:hypothetical protein